MPAAVPSSASRPVPRPGPRPVFAAPAVAGRRTPAGTSPRPRPAAVLRGLAAYYRDPLSWLALLVTSVALCFLGGGAMFWFHAEYLDEGGPAIPWYVHWLLDSTFGFLVLTPALALLIPLAVWAASASAGRIGPGWIPRTYAVLLGTAFAVLATPGPVAHDLVVGRGTWVADQVTRWFGDPSAPPSPEQHYALLAKLAQQLGFGLALYPALAYLSAVLVQAIVAARVTRLAAAV